MLQDDRRVPRGFNEAASRGQRIPAFDVLNPASANENFNEAASRGQRIRDHVADHAAALGLQ